ncbi:dipeptidyl-peptidase 3 [Penicillium verhagenii]|nr:dipeptidyl-peptidase 3 [Penicillium verhagenii]
MLGYDQRSKPSVDDRLRTLRSFTVESQTWNGDLDQDGGSVLRIEHNVEEKTLFVRVDHSKLCTHGKPCIGRILCKIHIWHLTADIEACRPLYDVLSAVDGEFEEWRKIAESNPEPKWKFVQPNTFFGWHC